MPNVTDKPTFSERLSSIEKATWGVALDRPSLTAITFFVIMALFGASVELMVMLFVTGWYGYCAGQRKGNRGQNTRREV